MDVFGWIFVVGCLVLLGIWVWYRDWTPEPFQVPLAWVQSRLDKQVRQGNSCAVLERFADSELAGAIVELVDNSCESGLPHTVGLHNIRIPEAAWNSPRRESILRHERVHLLQRRHQEAWNTFYREEWQYSLHTSPPVDFPPEEAANVRGNPDTFPARWAAWRDRYWFVPTYRNASKPQLPDAVVRVWDSNTRTWLDQVPYEWRTTFCTEQGRCPHQWEHPAEISAEYVTDGDWTTPAAMSLRRFLDTLKDGKN
jgi:hypothetical protein